MTDLSVAYGDMMGDSQPVFKPMQQPVQQVQQLPAQPPQYAPPPPQQMQEPVHNYNPPPAMYASQKAGPLASASAKHEEYSFWDRLASKRIDVLKLIVLALVLLLGLALHHVCKHYLDTYIAASFMTTFSEAMVRISYPVIIILIIWIMKAL